MLIDHSMRASLQVAPLELTKPHAEVDSNGSYDQHESSGPSANSNAVYLQSQMTPPDTPNSSQEDLLPESEQFIAPAFHNFLRAFYPFHPTYAMTDSSVTLPLDEGDVVLVHSIHTNGWADGTLLASGARGWLPTNYCEAYEPEEMCSLLKSLLNFWDLLRSTSVDDREIFQNQEFMKGIIGGVRYLLDRTHCLKRESIVFQRSEPLRKCRKALLSDLSLLVKMAKRLQEIQGGPLRSSEDVNDIVDHMILRAFKIVTKGVRFLDVVDDDRRARAPAAVTVMSTVMEESYIPPTPPADRAIFDERSHGVTDDGVSRTTADSTPTNTTRVEAGESRQSYQGPWSRRLSSLNSHTGTNSQRQSQSSFTHGNRGSANMAHRLSIAGPSPLSQPDRLVSVRLDKSFNKLISHLGYFVGRLNQSQSRHDISTAIKQSATSGGELLAIIDAVCQNTSPIPVALNRSREALLERIHTLVLSAQDTLANTEMEGVDMVMLSDTSILHMSVMDYVKAAGEGLNRAKAAIEKIGDFELESGENALQIDLGILDIEADRSRRPSVADASEIMSVAGSAQAYDSINSSHRRPSAAALDKPLPRVPDASESIEESNDLMQSPHVSRPASVHEDVVSSMASSVASIRPTLPELPKLTTTLLPLDHQNPADGSGHENDFQSRFDSIAGSSAGSITTYLSRDSEASIISQSSTRATTPDHTLVPRNQPSISELSATGSSTHTEECDDVESKLLEKTYAHELVFNKEGQVTGGSLPALVERLTTHEATPDATFVSTFYLTFRLFCTPMTLTEALIDRFEYVGESPQTSSPVRLRVYNAFKGWLESHWRDQTDRDALNLIMPFAETRLSAVLPSAGCRLLELAQRVSGDGALVPRLVSSIGKTNTAIGQYVPADIPLPSPLISKSQQNALQAFKAGTSSPTILDFDPLELARQLTIRQMNIFCSILPEELLSSQWMKKGGIEAPNVKAMSSLSTDLSNLVAETILNHGELKKRAAVIKQWIKIAQQCLELHNYDGLMAIICSLNSSTISRLRKTWDAVSLKRREILRNLQEIVEPSQNNKVLRTRLHDHVPPCLPFLGMYLTDLTFVDIGNPATKQMSLGSESEEDGACGLTVVNFDKHTRTAKIIGELQRFQIPYRLIELPDMQDWFSAQIQRIREGDQGNVQVTYYRRSLLLEPRETTARREVETPTPTPPSTAVSRGDLFSWMTRGGQGLAPTSI